MSTTLKRQWYPTEENGLSEAQCRKIEDIRNNPSSGTISDIVAYYQMKHHNSYARGKK